MPTTHRDIVQSIEGEYRRYQVLGQGALKQVADNELCLPANEHDNSIVAIIWHLTGNLGSRFTDFRTADGEKPWRVREEEFDHRVVTRDEVMQRWTWGWTALFTATAALTDDDLGQTVTIRRQPLRIDQALHRSLAHTAYHVGQIVYIAKALRGSAWRSLSIPRGQSEAYNAAPTHERPPAHADISRRPGG